MICWTGKIGGILGLIPVKKVKSHSSKTIILISIQAQDHLKMGVGACIELNAHLDGSLN